MNRLMPTNSVFERMSTFSRWRQRFKTRIRYRLLALILWPMLVTEAVLMLGIGYGLFTTHWQQTLQSSLRQFTAIQAAVDHQQTLDELEPLVKSALAAEISSSMLPIAITYSRLGVNELGDSPILSVVRQANGWQLVARQVLYTPEHQPLATLNFTQPFLAWLAAPLHHLALFAALSFGALLTCAGILLISICRLIKPIERILRVVKLVQLGKSQRIGQLALDQEHELALLAKQFDYMLDLLDQRNHELAELACKLEVKVQQRTQSLKEKTEQLETHIDLLNQTRNKLITNEKLAALGELTAGIAHEINNPAAVILGNVELIEFALGKDSEKVADEIQAILAQIDRIRNITRSLLQYSRQGGRQDQVIWQHLSPIIAESITLVNTGVKKRDVEFVTELNATTSVEINRHHLLQVLVNLLVNGIHAMDGKGKLVIQSENWQQDGELKGAIIRVCDEGCGIKPELQGKIFSPFFTTKRYGTGLGLSVSQSLLSQIGGEICVRSTWGVGSEFCIYLPVKANSERLVATD